MQQGEAKCQNDIVRLTKKTSHHPVERGSMMLTMNFKKISLKVPGREQPTYQHVTERLAV